MILTHETYEPGKIVLKSMEMEATSKKGREEDP